MARPCCSEVDCNGVRKQVLTSLFREVRGVLHDARINLPNHLAVHSGSVKLRPLAGDFEAALAKLRDLSRPFNGVRPVELTMQGRTDSPDTDRSPHQGVRTADLQSVDRDHRRLSRSNSIFEREDANRLSMQVPRLGAGRTRPAPDTVRHRSPD